MIYLDNSATTPLDPKVKAAMEPYLAEKFGNASSIHRLGREARVALEEARATLARQIGADPAEIVFTSGGTESNSHAILGSIAAAIKNGSPSNLLSVLTTPVEHHSVLGPAELLGSLGIPTTYTAVDGIGRALLNEDILEPTVASIMHVNNEIGTINAIASLTAELRSRFPKILIHTDAIQSLGKMPIDAHALGVDLMSFSAHKIYGPKGIGALYIRRTVKIEPLLHGGAQERNRRGGTEAVALAVGFAEAARLATAEFSERSEAVKQLRTYMLQGLATIPSAVINSPTDGSGVDEILSITFTSDILRRLEPETLVVRLDLAGIAVSNGAACTSGTLQPSHVLKAIGKSDDVAAKSIRISFDHHTTANDLDTLIRELRNIFNSL